MNRLLGDELRQLFDREIGAPPLEVRQRVLASLSHESRQPVRRWQGAAGVVAGVVAALLAVAVVATLLVAYENQRSVPGNQRTGVVPWLPLPAQLAATGAPSPTPSPLPAGTQPCTTSQLQIVAWATNGAGGHAFRSFGLSGRGPNVCYLNGSPAVELFDMHGRLLPFKPRPLFGGTLLSGPVLIEPGPVPDPASDLKSGQASLTVDWVTQGEACSDSSASVQLASARITLPGGGDALSAALSGDPGAYVCGGLGIGAFEGPPPTMQEIPTLPLPGVTMRVPSSVRAGEPLVYAVTLTNPTGLPMDLATNCPNYGEQLFPNDSIGNPPGAIKPMFQLNCKPAGTIQPSKSLTFEMRLAVPTDEAPGSYTLYFALGYWNAMTTPAGAPVTITK